MRIISGKHRGRRLAAPRNDAIRPTTDRIRESLFSILGDLHETVVVDAYAGTGALGCESLSRGADHVFFFDPARDAIALITQNVEQIGEGDRSTITRAKFAAGIAAIDRLVDLVFLDPPYGSDEPSIALQALTACEWIDESTTIVLEQDAHDDLPDHSGFVVEDSRQYGNTVITFLTKSPTS